MRICLCTTIKATISRLTQTVFSSDFHQLRARAQDTAGCRAGSRPYLEQECIQCNVVKPAKEFDKNGSGLNGLRRACKACMKVRLRSQWVFSGCRGFSSYQAKISASLAL